MNRMGIKKSNRERKKIGKIIIKFLRRRIDDFIERDYHVFIR
jgi:hypothetical protein